MAHFAKLDENNIVTEVHVVHNNEATNEEAGINFLKNLLKEPDSVWKQTSYNTHGGVHVLGGTPFRKNFASQGYTYDTARDAFIAPKPFDSWTFDETTCLWNPPVPYPENASFHEWNEETQQWDPISDT
jgi:hypothetical protein